MTDTLRVETMGTFIGQTALKDRLNLHIQAAKAEHRTMEHVFLTGPPGFGKTSLASLIAKELVVPFTEYTMPLDEKAILQMIQLSTGVVLLDELHRASDRLQESLLPLLEFGYFQRKSGWREENHDITFVGATTEKQDVIDPLIDRFGIQPHFDPYSEEEMGKIVIGMASKLEVKLSQEDAIILGNATGGTPRRARQFVLTAKDLQVTKVKVTADAVLKICRVDREGISQPHMEYLQALKLMGGQAGLKTLQNVLRISEDSVRDLERLLVAKELITYSERGRELRHNGFKKLQEAA